MKVAYVKLRDPVAWKKSDEVFFQEDLPHFVCNVLRTAGIVIHEDENRLVLGEVSTAEDNPEMEEFGVIFPRYRGVMIVAKENIIDRQDFVIGESDLAEAIVLLTEYYTDLVKELEQKYGAGNLPKDNDGWILIGKKEAAGHIIMTLKKLSKTESAT